ncbi:MAG: hypothetical protein GKS07_07750 [Nitrosopumilus sp.]|nr:MAG: hypothetical protein GKS07_07750 [Nitrosopumilus sp.]
MNAKYVKTIGSEFTETFEDACNDDSQYKTCPYCGQSKIPFKMGVCICGAQVGKIRYVTNSKKYAKNWYSYVGNSKIEKMGIVELMDN